MKIYTILSKRKNKGFWRITWFWIRIQRGAKKQPNCFKSWFTVLVGKAFDHRTLEHILTVEAADIRSCLKLFCEICNSLWICENASPHHL